ncbi:hypothetical protein SteCoe_2309 [Stentor coeruleus]|uniref:Uncharacterized protein n=1 Tax=Stentor coeruleus TaxID=5963 RepID=A0A1R2CZU1_9CILI|nr:hypothetical protein SteCoe_2309 [Stentor coeruleus]
MAKPSDHFNYSIKFIIIGDFGVGKTSFLHKFLQNSPNSKNPTEDIDFELKILEIEGKTIKFIIWDTLGQERFRNMNQIYFNKAMGIIAIYDCTDENSFNNIRHWIQQVKNFAHSNSCIALVENKCDLLEIKVTNEEGEALAKELGIMFFKTSTVWNININEVFINVAKVIIDRIVEEKMLVRENIQVNRVEEQKNQGRC